MKTKTTLIAAAAAIFAVSAIAENVSSARIDEKQAVHDSGFMQRHNRALKHIRQNQTKHFDLVMVGDSITHFWDTNGKDVRDVAFANLKVLNCGHSGDRVENVLWRLDHGELDGYTTPLFQVLIGTNNRSDSAEEIADGIKNLLGLIREKHPESRILLIPILPRSDFNDKKNQTAEVFAKLQSVNPLIKPLADGDKVIWFDIASKFRNEDGSINESLFKDHLHPNKAGYRVWAASLEPYLPKKAF